MAIAVAQRRQAWRLARELGDAVARHRLLTFASAVSFRALVALVPLVLLGLGVLGALGEASVWTNSIAPAIKHHVTAPVFHGIDFSVQRIFASDKGSLITLATALVLGIGRWLVAAVLLGVAIGVLVRYAPAEHPRPRWASAGSVAIVVAWIVLSLVFRVWVSDVSNFKTGIGFLTAFLVLGAYLYLSVLVFVLGVQLDELLRKKEEGRS